MSFVFSEQILKHPAPGRSQHQGSRGFPTNWVSFQAPQMKIEGSRSLLETGPGYHTEISVQAGFEKKFCLAPSHLSGIVGRIK